MKKKNLFKIQSKHILSLIVQTDLGVIVIQVRSWKKIFYSSSNKQDIVILIHIWFHLTMLISKENLCRRIISFTVCRNFQWLKPSQKVSELLSMNCQIMWLNWSRSKASNTQYVCSNLTFTTIFESFRLVQTPTTDYRNLTFPDATHD